jgi:EAL domain-containing protein (putative c-di-GMP-specific phosphodiesterase class I)
MSQMPEHLHVAVNLSAVNLLKTDTTTLFRRAIETFDIAPARLTVELTESEFMDDTGRVEASLQELARLGVGVAVDDFGTGYSSLSHLRSLPLTELKVDRQFVSSMVHSPPDRVVVQALVGLAHDLGLTLTAEGVEDRQTLTLLQDMGCDTVQGYFFGRPVPIAQFSQDLADQGLLSPDLSRHSNTA